MLNISSLEAKSTHNNHPERFRKIAEAHLCKELGMDNNQIAEMLVTLAQPLEQTLKATESAYLAQDLNCLAETAHALKGALLNLGLNKLALLVNNIEQSAKNNETKSHEKRLFFIRDNLADLIT